MRYDPAAVPRAVERVKERIAQVSLDLIFGVPGQTPEQWDADLGRARSVRAAANKGEWLKVFMELGFLQQDIMKKIDSPEQSNHGTLLIVTGWMQGARYTSTVIDENYSPETSNLLREPLLAKALKDGGVETVKYVEYPDIEHIVVL